MSHFLEMYLLASVVFGCGLSLLTDLMNQCHMGNQYVMKGGFVGWVVNIIVIRGSVWSILAALLLGVIVLIHQTFK